MQATNRVSLANPSPDPPVSRTPAGTIPTARSDAATISLASRLLLGAGLVGAVLFPVIYLLDGALRPGYNTLAEPISALALGPAAWVQISNFIIYGILIVVSAIGWRAALTPGPAAVWYPASRVLSGFALIATGIFHAGLIHNAVSYTSLIATVVGLFVLARRLHREPGWRGWDLAAVGTAVLEMGFLAAFGRLSSHGGGGGGFEKLATITVAAFIIVFTARVLARHGRLAISALA
ncbi:MAG: DUF998 domain-containing protein [Chloroflexota bacterium]|nr:DUF998 domain-containing protein [Chloroflexota bacterium]